MCGRTKENCATGLFQKCTLNLRILCYWGFYLLPLFSFRAEIALITVSTNGTPTNIIQGTSVTVRISVLKYNGSADSCCPNMNKNSVIDG